jgi:hypothetical protein
VQGTVGVEQETEKMSHRALLRTGLAVGALALGVAGCAPVPAEKAAQSGGSSAAKNISKGVGGTSVGGGGVCAAKC